MHGFPTPGSVPYVLSSPRDHRLGPTTRPQPRPQSVSVTTPMEAAGLACGRLRAGQCWPDCRAPASWGRPGDASALTGRAGERPPRGPRRGAQPRAGCWAS